MSGFPQQENYWSPHPQDTQYNFENNSFGQPNQQFEFTNFSEQPAVDYGAYTQQDYLNPNQSSYSGNLFSPPDNYNQG